ncbi:hypothetical protein OSB04_028909 [Centaurea solstitialis]|uniref:Uncharacterized protein n=1 Tax=Centaurea solstitialis TaxID=347529 RepID=A0AA38SP42_9ASTR|nr:hypothetical protein OSB04_028909 [Centaurea solstitialis]
MVDILVTIAAEGILKKVLSIASSEVIVAWGFEKKLATLHEMLDMIRAKLRDADRQKGKQEAVMVWLKKLKELVGEADDVLDEIHYETLRREIKKRDRVATKVPYLPSLKKFAFRREMGHKIENITKKLCKINKRANDLGLHDEQVGLVPSCPPRETDSFLDEFNIVGRENDVLHIIELLTKSIREENFKIIPIVGMGGIGKTSLAKLVYNNQKVEEHFDVRAWLCVSVAVDVNTLLAKIYESITEKACKVQTRDILIRNLQKELRGKRYLLVLDDVWDENQEHWDDFSSCMLKVNSRNGSVILVTTRKVKIGTKIMTNDSYALKCLSDDQCWSIFQERVFVAGRPLIPELVEIGHDIVKKCCGLPLLVKVIGSLLRSHNDKDKWLSIKASSVWDLEGGERVLSALKLSFDNLPTLNVKQCFVYCSIFEKDMIMEREQLIQLWMALGFLQADETRNKEMEDMGNDVFQILVNNSLFQDVEMDEYGYIACCKMHDLVHDLSLSLSRDESVRLMVPRDDHACISQVKHVAIYRDTNMNLEVLFGKMVSKVFKVDTTFRTLQTLFISGGVEKNISFQNFKCLRILKFAGCSLEEIHNSIGELLHLRYLDFSYTDINVLPKSIGRLYHLQTLKLRDCYRLKGLPEEMKNLISLRHLEFDSRRLSPKVGNLTSLQTLSSFVVSQEKGCQIEELGCLKHLRGKLRICNLEKIRSGDDSAKANLSRKNLFEIEFIWRNNEGTNRIDKDVLEALQPHAKVKSIKIQKFSGDSFPTWVMDMAINTDTRWIPLEKLVTITLSECCNCVNLPTLHKLPLLRELVLEYMDKLTYLSSSLGHDNKVDGSTKPVSPSLRFLKLVGMRSLEKWTDATMNSSTMLSPVLEKLYIIDCPKIIHLDEYHHHPLISLVIQSCKNLESIRSIQGLTSLQSLTISHCPSLLGIPDLHNQGCSLNYLRIGNCGKITSLPGGFDCLAFVNNASLGWFSNKLHSFPSLQGIEKSKDHIHTLRLTGWPHWKSIPKEVKYLTTLTSLTIIGFGLEELPIWLRNMSSIRHIHFYDCRGLDIETVSRGAPREAHDVYLDTRIWIDYKTWRPGHRLNKALFSMNNTNMHSDAIGRGRVSRGSSAGQALFSLNNTNMRQNRTHFPRNHKSHILVFVHLPYLNKRHTPTSISITVHKLSLFLPPSYQISGEMADDLVTISAYGILKKVLSITTNKAVLAWGYEENLTALHDTLVMIRAKLQDADRKKGEQKAVMVWLKKLNLVVGEADDVMDELHYETLRCEVEKREQVASKLPYLSSLKTFAFRVEIGYKIKNISKKLYDINKEATSLGLHDEEVGCVLDGLYYQETNSFLDEFKIVGREKDEQHIIELLTISRKDEKVLIVPIVGMGGIGKTTLAESVFNNRKIAKHFDKRVWLSVQGKINVDTLLAKLFSKIYVSLNNEEFKGDVNKRPSEDVGRKEILVLDDVLDQNQEHWVDLRSCMLDVNSHIGNAILVTTQNLEIKINDTIPSYTLDVLSDDECWSIFKERAFVPGSSLLPELEEIGLGIVKKCCGLPLVVKVIGSMLRYYNDDIEKWLSIKDSKDWDLGEDNSLRALTLSFDNLPNSMVKQCFAYCSIFEKDTIMYREELIQFWMALGFIQKDETRNKEMEDVGNDIFHTLVSTSLFQDVHFDEYGYIDYCKMHHLVHDLSLSLSSHTSSGLVGSKNNGVHDSQVKKIFLAQQDDPGESIDISSGPRISLLFKEDTTFRTLHTLMFFIGRAHKNISFQHFKFLRILSFAKSTELQDIHDSIGVLVHLRYLDLSYTNIIALPNSICKLYNLQTLSLFSCNRLMELPEDMSNLISLRHLICDKWYFRTPRDVGQLTSLRILSSFCVGRGKGYQMEELGRLKHLGGKLSIHYLENVVSKEDAAKAYLFGKKNLYEIEFHWTRDTLADRNDKDVLEGLQPHAHVKCLKVFKFSGDNFPPWARKMAISIQGKWTPLEKLVDIKLSRCPNCLNLPMLGNLPLLRNLVLEYMGKVTCLSSFSEQDDGFTRPTTKPLFPSLRSLALTSMKSLKKWTDAAINSSTMLSPVLEKLHIYDCPKLTVLDESQCHPLVSLIVHSCKNLKSIQSLQGLTSLESLSIAYCDSLLEIPDMHRLGCSLKRLTITDCNKLTCLPAGFDCLDSLHHLSLGRFSNELHSFPSLQGIEKLRNNLRSLHLFGWDHWEVIPEEVKNLTALISLSIIEFGIQEMPEWLTNMSSIRLMRFSICKRLAYESISQGAPREADSVIFNRYRLRREGLNWVYQW